MPNKTILDNRTNITVGNVTWKNLQDIIKDMEEDQLNSKIYILDESGKFIVDGPDDSLSGYVPVINIGLTEEDGNVFLFVDSDLESDK
jgi:hypothetical protein